MDNAREDTFIFYRSFYEAIQMQPDKDRLALYDAICALALNGEQIALAKSARPLWILMCPIIEANRAKRKNGRKGGRPVSNEATGFSEHETTGFSEHETTGFSEDETNDTDGAKPNIEYKIGNLNHNRNGLMENKAPKRFTPPTVDEVRAYCDERRNSVDAARFVDYYASNGWKVGRNPMKDWKAAVRNWEHSRKDDSGDRLDNLRNLYTDFEKEEAK